MTEPVPKPAKQSRRWRWRTALALLLIPFLLAVAAFAVIQTAWFKDFAAAAAANLLGPMIGQEIEITGLRGFVPFRLELDRFAMADPEGEWLAVEQVYLEWSWQAILGMRIVVDDLTVQRVVLPRIGAFPESDADPEPFSLPAIPQLPPWLEIKRLVIERAEIGEAILQEDAVFRLNGALVQPGAGLPSTLDLELARLDADTAAASIHIALSPAALAVDISARDDSILPGLLGLDGPAELSLMGDAPPGDWHGTLSAAIGNEPLLDGILRLHIGADIDASARLTFHAAHPIVPAAVSEQVGARVALVFDLRVDGGGRVHIAGLTATSPSMRVAIAGLLDLPADAVDLQVEARHDDIGPLAGLEPELGRQPVEAVLHLRGSPSNLAIDIDSTWDGRDLAQGAVTLGLEGGLAIGVNLRVAPPEFFLPSAEAAALIADGVTIAADIPSISGERIRIATLDVTGIEGFTLHGDADLDLEHGDGRAAFLLEIASLQELAFLTGLDMAGALTATVDAVGTGDRMDITASISGDALRFQQYAIGTLELSLDGGLQGWAGGGPRGITATWQGDATGLELEPYPGEQLRTEGQLDAPTLDEINLPRVFLSDGVVDIEASGRFLPSSTSGSLDVTAVAASFAPYGERMGTDLTGMANLHLRATLDEGAESGSAELDANLTQLAGLPEAAQGLIGAALNAQLRVTLADGLATLEALTLAAAHVNATGAGSYALESGALEGNLVLTLPDLAAAHAVLGPDATGAVRVDAEVGGTVEAMTASARLTGTNTGAFGGHADELALTVTASGLPATPSGTLSLTAVERGQQLDAEAAFAFADAVVSATGIALTLGGNRLDADAQYGLESGLPDIAATLDMGDLAAFEPFLGVALGGSIRGDFAVIPSNGDAAANIALEAEEIAAPFGSVSRLTVSGRADSVLQAPSGSLNASLTALNAGAVRVDALSAFIEGDMAAVSLQAEIAGNIAEAAPFSLRLEAGAAPADGRATIQMLDGVLEQYPIALESPAAIAFNDDELRLEPLVVRLGNGSLEAHALRTSERVDARIVWSDLPLAIANAFGAPEVSGAARGQIDLSGPLSEPVLTASVEVVELRTALAIEPDAPSLSAAVNARVSSTALHADAWIGMSDDTRLDAEAVLPVAFSLEPFTFDIPDDGALDARILGDLLLRDPLSFAGLVDHQFKGTLSLDYRIQGAPASPDVQGSARLENGRYENAVTGSVLDAIDLQVDTNGAGLAATMRATDGGTGALTLDAQTAISPAAAFPFSLDGSLEDFVIVRRDDATAQVAGTLDASGDLTAMTVNGDFVIGPANIVLSVPRGGAIPEVDYIEVGEGYDPDEDEQTDIGVDTPLEVALNIQTRFPNRVNIRGPGLESEWSGNISVTGTAADPIISGELRVLRGYLDLLNKRFMLTDSLIVLDGSIPPNPYINVRGETRAGNVTAFVLITGTPDALTLRLESDPPLPQDEVLSRVLFDRPIQDITPVQALQLARAAAQLSGNLRGGSILGARGGLLPIDRLDFSPDIDGTGETTVGAGAYISDDIYVEVRQRLQSGSTAVSVDVELRRNLSVQGIVDSEGRTGAGVLYKRDY